MSKNGILITNKPEGMSSFQMCSKVKREYGEKKVGHIGTLDPLASGVLPILIGKATKFSEFLVEHDKEYIAEIQLGMKTETGDREGKVIEEKPVRKYTSEEIKNALDSFLGKTMQIPPMYSALKLNGKKLYELAREGKTVERKARPIIIDSIELISYDSSKNIINFKVNCSRGTYIRVLSEDIAEKLGTCGYMSHLIRTRVGNYSLKDENKFIDMENILDLDKISIDESTLKKVLNGVRVNWKSEDKLVSIYVCKEFKGVGYIKNNILKRKIMVD